jgi:hypothetical protein
MTSAPRSRLNIGSGRRPVDGALNLDDNDQVGADLLHDLNCLPCPFGDDTFDEIHATAIDGLVAVMAMPSLVPWLGLPGAALGSIVGTAAVSLPGNLYALEHEEGVSLIGAIRPFWSCFDRFLLASGTVLVATAWWPEQGLFGRLVHGSLVSLLSALLMLPILLKPPLGTMLAPCLLPWLALIPSLSRRLARQSMP